MILFGKYKAAVADARREVHWYQEEYALLQADNKAKAAKIRDLQGECADLACKLDRYERCATEAVKKKVAALEAQNEAELKAIGDALIKDGKYQPEI